MRWVPLLVLLPTLALAGPNEDAVALDTSLNTIEHSADEIRWLSHESVAQPKRLECVREQLHLVEALEQAGRLARSRYLVAESGQDRRAIDQALQRAASAADLSLDVAAEARACSLLEPITEGTTSLVVVQRSPKQRQRFGPPTRPATNQPAP